MLRQSQGNQKHEFQIVLKGLVMGPDGQRLAGRLFQQQ